MRSASIHKLSRHFELMCREAFTHHHVIEHRNHQQGQYRGDENPEDQADRQTIEDRIIEDKHCANHGRQGGQHDRFGCTAAD